MKLRVNLVIFFLYVEYMWCKFVGHGALYLLHAYVRVLLCAALFLRNEEEMDRGALSFKHNIEIEWP